MKSLVTLMILTLMCACSGSADRSASAANSTAQESAAYAEQGSFSADSALAFVKAQTDLGPRVPGSDAHSRCVSYLTAQLNRLGADTVTIMGSRAEVPGLGIHTVRNIFARYCADKPARLLLMAHYDSRPWADQEHEPADRERPIDGANDGASGVAVILEIARNLQLMAPQVGVDILLTDLEDSGTRSDAPQTNDSERSWCIGARQFADNLPYSAADMPRYGILLDMVGGRSARFNREYFSVNAAPVPTARVWDMARRLGLSARFPMSVGGAITDDHLPLIRAGIQVTDIVENENPSTGSFNPTWHTHADTFENIDPSTLEAVGRVVLNVIYNEKP